MIHQNTENNGVDLGPCALTEIAWIPTEAGMKTPLDMLLNPIAPIRVRSGMAYMAIIRFLTSIMAVAMQFDGAPSEANIRRAIKALQPYSRLYDPRYPFMQRPANKAEIEKIRMDAPSKLDLSTPADSARQFWDLLLDQPQTFTLSQAILPLLVFNFYGPSGNNKFGNDKCQMGAPGFRFLGAGNTATELMWLDKDDFIRTLLMNLPQSWCKPGALPAWADRDLSVSSPDHPLWRATWSSNTVVCQWENDQLIGVKRCGVPDSWYAPSAGVTKEERKAWWDERNTQDPFYLYVANAEGELKARRLDFGTDATELAVRWNQVKIPEYLAKRDAIVVEAHEESDELVFARHLIAGTSSSTLIRRSELLHTDSQLWMPDTAERQNAVLVADLIFEMRKALWIRMNREETFVQLTPDAMTAFWRKIKPVFEGFMHEQLPIDGDDSVVSKTRQATIDAFLKATEPLNQIKLPQIQQSRRLLYWDIEKRRKALLGDDEDE